MSLQSLGRWLTRRWRASTVASDQRTGAPFFIEFAQATDPGLRSANEDCSQVHVPTSGDPNASRGWIAVISDGMGGHNAGAQASRLVVETVVREYYRSRRGPAKALESAIFEANRRLIDEASRNSSFLGMGATCTALAGEGRKAVAAHVGDSRLYLLRDNAIVQLTKDHYCEERRILTRALGRQDLSVARWDEPLWLHVGDRIVLCTDGLYRVADLNELSSVVRSRPPSEACADLMRLVKSRAGADNATVIILSVLQDGSLSKVSAPTGSLAEVTR